jgi:hypothetical protein
MHEHIHSLTLYNNGHGRLQPSDGLVSQKCILLLLSLYISFISNGMKDLCFLLCLCVLTTFLCIDLFFQ